MDKNRIRTINSGPGRIALTLAGFAAMLMIGQVMAAPAADACTNCAAAATDPANISAAGSLWITAWITLTSLVRRIGLNRLLARIRRLADHLTSPRFRARIAHGFLATSLVATTLVVLPPIPEAEAAWIVDSMETGFAEGAFIIDMGVTPQTFENGLKPYGLIYELMVTNGIPVIWAINENKAKDGDDFTVASVNGGGPKTYRGGPFVIEAEWASAAAPIISAWTTLYPGMVVDQATSDFTVPVFETMNSWPNIALDAGKGGIAGGYYENADIPEAAYSTVDPSIPYDPAGVPFPTIDQPLSKCIDFYAMPHADPAWDSHSAMVDFNNDGGYIWAGCHAVSVLENVDDPSDGDITPNMNFLSNEGLVDFGDHGSGSGGPYTYDLTNGADPIMQFLGVIDGATEGGSEQIYIPTDAGWRPSTTVLAWDDFQEDLVANGGDYIGPAAKLVYGRGFGIETNGLVMYEGGHTLSGPEPDTVAAQRAFLNLNLLAGIERGIKVTTTIPDSIAAGDSVPVSAAASGGSGGYTYTWTSECGGTFDDPNAASTNFNSPATYEGRCAVTVEVSDNCGHTTKAAERPLVAPEVDLSIVKTDDVDPIEPGNVLTYTLTVTNESPGSLATNVMVTDTPPAEVAVTSVTASQGTCSMLGGINCNLGDLAGGASATVTVAADVLPTADGTITNTAAVMGDQPDPDPGNNSASEDTVAGFRDLQITKTPSADYVNVPSGPIAYSYDVWTTGTNPITGVSVTDDLCSPLTLAGGDDGDNILEPGETWTYTCGATISVDTTNTAQVFGTDPVDGPIESFPVTATVEMIDPQIEIRKGPDPTTAASGGVAIFTIEVENTGTGFLTDVVVTDPLVPACDRTFDYLAEGEVRSFVCAWVGVVPPVTNTITADALDPLGDPAPQGTDTADVVLGTAELAVTKTVTPTDAYPGDPVSYTIVTENISAVTQTNITVADSFPVGLNQVPGSTDLEKYTITQDDFSSGNYDGGVGLWNSGWIDQHDGDPTGGDIFVSGGEVQYDNKDKELDRPINLDGATSADISLDWWGDASGWKLKIEFFDGSGWVDVYEAPDNSAPGAPTNVSFGLPGPFSSANQVRVYATANDSGVMHIDNVEVTATTSTVLVAGPSTQDDFSSNDYTGGTGAWVGNWIDAEDNDHTIGDVYVSGSELHFLDKKALDRGIDLTGAGAATISMDWQAGDPKFELLIEFYDGSSWIEIYHSPGDGAPATWTNVSFALPGPFNATNQIRIEAADKQDPFTMDVDNVVVQTFVPAPENDPSPGPLTTGVNLLPGEQLTVTYDAVVDPTIDTSIAEVTNIGSATSDLQTDPIGDIANVNVVNPAMLLTKTVEPGAIAPGESVTFTIEVSNTGNGPLSNVAVSDPTCSPVFVGGDDDSDNQLDVNEVWTYTCSMTLVADTTNTATVTADDELGNPVAPQPEHTDTAAVDVVLSDIAITKSASPLIINSGDFVTWTFDVTTNGGDEPLSNVTITDAACSPITFVAGDDNANGKLDQAETFTFECTNNVTADITNTATASGTDRTGGIQTAVDSVTVDVINPGISISKSASPNPVPNPGDPTTVTLVVNNTGDDPLASVVVTDDQCGATTYASGDTNINLLLDVTETWNFTCTFNPTEDVTNVADVMALDSTGRPVTDFTTDLIDVVTASYEVGKVPSASAVEYGDSVTYTYKIENTGNTNITVDPLDISDDKCGPLVYSHGDAGVIGEIDVGETWFYTCTSTLFDDTTNTFTVADATEVGTGVPLGPESVSTFVNVAPNPTLTKTPDPTLIPHDGGDVTFDIVVDNDGIESFDVLSLIDDIYGDITDPANPLITGSTTCSVPQTIAGGAGYACSFTTFVSGPLGFTETDTVTATVEDDEFTEVTAFDSATVSSGSGDISGSILLDLNADTDLTDGTALSGVLVTLTWAGPNGPETYSVTTGPAGTYAFDGLPAGDYTISIDPASLPAGLVATTDPDGTGTPDIAGINLATSSSTSSGNDFGYAGDSSVSGSLLLDTLNDGPGPDDIAFPVDSVTVTADWTDPVTGNTATFTTETDAAGTYAFANIPAGEVVVTVDGTDPDFPAGFTETFDPDPNPVVVPPTTPVTDQNFGYTGDAGLSGSLFHDVLADGAGADDLPVTLAGITVTAEWTDPVSGITHTFTTETLADGSYSFANLPAGDYVVSVDTLDPDFPAALNTASFAPTPLTIGPAGSATDLDFGFTGDSTLSGALIHDVLGDGPGGVDDQPILAAGVPITATWTDPVTGLTASYATETLADGSYSFTSLPAGDYDITVLTTDPDFPTGLNTETYNPGTVSLPATTNSTDNDFGYTGDAGLSGSLFHDVLGDGAGADDLAVSLAGITVTAEWTDPVTGLTHTFTTETAADGTYTFAGLPEGDYTISVDTLDTDFPAALNTETFTPAPVSITSGSTTTDLDFGYTGTSSLAGTLNHDTDGDGSGDQPILSAGIPVTATWTDPVSGLTATYTTETLADGTYLFENLPAGDYDIVVNTTDPDFPTGLNTETYNPGTITVPDNTPVTGNDIGYTGDAGLSGALNHDVLGDGAGVDDVPLPAGNVLVTATWTDPVTGLTATYTTNTDPTGAYSFTSLPAGDYDITVLTTDPDFPTGLNTETYNPGTVSLPATTNSTDNDFGYTGDAGLSGSLFHDVLGDGAGADDLAVSLAGITVTAEWTDPVTGLTHTFTTETAADGTYTFAGLPEGDYTISVDTLDTDFPAALNTETFTPAPVSITSGSTTTDLDFGYTGTSSLAGTLNHDTDGDGSGDQPILSAGIPVTATWTDPVSGLTATYTTETLADGTYLFENLPAGDYDIVVNTTDPDFPTGLNTETYNPGTITVPDNTPVTGNDIGYTGDTAMSGSLLHDVLADGAGADDLPVSLAGITVTATWTDPATGVTNTYVTETLADGTYTFAGLPEGDYDITVLTTDPDFPAALNTETFNPGTISLVTGVDQTDLDFGYTGASSLAGTLNHDTDGDGSGDQPILSAGIPVTATWTDPVSGLTATYTTETLADGTYLFENLPAGDYDIVVNTTDPDFPTGLTTETYNPTTVAVADTANVTGADVGYTGDSSVAGLILHDTDGDGTGDLPISGVIVETVWTDPATGLTSTYSATTDATGAYAFVNLPAGDYVTTVDTDSVPTGLELNTLDPDGTNDSTTAFSLVSGESLAGQDFAYTGDNTIAGSLWYDWNADGVDEADPEIPLEGIIVTATWDGPDGPVEYTTSTDAAGAYSFDGLPAGDYDVTIDPTSLPIGLDAETFDADGLLDSTTAATVVDGVPLPPLDFGYTGNSFVGGTLWFDANGDGDVDAGEIPLSGVEVSLTWAGPTGPTTFTAITAPDGAYAFPNLPAGDFDLVVNTATLPDGLDPSFDPDSVFDDTTAITLLAGETAPSLDFGYSGGGAIEGTLWFEWDANGSQDPGEAAMADIDVLVSWMGPDGVPGTGDEVDYVATTDSSGTYSVVGLPAGSFTAEPITTTLPDGIEVTFDVDGDLDGHTPFTLGVTEALSGHDVGYTGLGEIGDQVWFDQDADALEDAPEMKFDGVTVDLEWAGFDGAFGTGDDMTGSTLTVAGNSYHFTNLAAGQYRVTVDTLTLPVGIRETFDLDGGFDYTSVVVLAASEIKTNVDFGITGTASITGIVFDDPDGDGSLEIGEVGLPGADVVLTWAGPDGLLGTPDDIVYPAVLTGGDGSYSLANLLPGVYEIAANSGSGDPTTPTTLLLTLAAGESATVPNVGFNQAALLPSTGAETELIARLALALLALGSALVIFSRRRRQTS